MRADAGKVVGVRIAAAVGIRAGVGVRVVVGVCVKVTVGVGDEVEVALKIGKGAAPQRLGVEIQPANRIHNKKILYFFMVNYLSIGIFNP